LLVLGLMPAAIFVMSLARRTWGFLRSHSRDDKRILLWLSVVGQFAFVALYSYRGRLYEFAKAIFLFPALIGIAWLLAFGVEEFDGRFRSPRIRLLLTCVTLLLLTGYIADVAVVIGDQWMLDPRHYWG
jgi:hypothetical protein